MQTVEQLWLTGLNERFKIWKYHFPGFILSVIIKFLVFGYYSHLFLKLGWKGWGRLDFGSTTTGLIVVQGHK